MARERPDPARDEDGEAPPSVITAIAAGVGPLPFLAVYAVLFLAHGFLYPVQPPDITSTRRGEAIAGVIALVLFVLVATSLWSFLTARRRWPFVVLQLATFGTAVDFVADSSTGSPAVPLLLIVTSGVALVAAFAGRSWEHVGLTPWYGQLAPRSAHRARRSRQVTGTRIATDSDATGSAATGSDTSATAVVSAADLVGDPLDPAAVPTRLDVFGDSTR